MAGSSGVNMGPLVSQLLPAFLELDLSQHLVLVLLRLEYNNTSWFQYRLKTHPLPFQALEDFPRAMRLRDMH